jgi:hypothetical protein
MASMASTETRLTRAAIALSVLLVMLLGGLAAYSVLGQDDDPEPVNLVAPDDVRAYPGPQLVIEDRGRPLTIGCVASDDDDGYTLLLTNRAGTAVDYTVSVSLEVDDERSVAATTEILGLQPDEQREVAVEPDRSDASVVGCSITAIQSDRRILLANA